MSLLRPLNRRQGAALSIAQMKLELAEQLTATRARVQQIAL